MLRSRVALSCLLIASVLSLSACMSLTPVAKEPTRVPVIYSSGPSMYSHEVLYTRGYYYGHGYHGYKHCYRVKGYYHHGKFVKRSYVSCGYGRAIAYRGYYGCTGYIPAYAGEDRVCSNWEWMPAGHHYGTVMYK